MVRPNLLLAASLLIALLAHTPAAYAVSSDPPAGSPAGAVYTLPLEQGRSDAAPKGSGGGSPGAKSGAGEGQDGETSLYRSENNFGSSSQVPGLPAARGGGPGSGDGGTAGGDSGGNTSEDSNAVLTGISSGGEDGPSATGSVALLVMIALLAGAAGLFSARAARRTSPG